MLDAVGEFIGFLTEVFGAHEDFATKEVLPDETIDHADVIIGDSRVMMSESPDPRPAVAFVYVPDVDGAYQRAPSRGSEPLLEPSVQPWGDRVAGFTNPGIADGGWPPLPRRELSRIRPIRPCRFKESSWNPLHYVQIQLRTAGASITPAGAEALHLTERQG